VRTIDAASRKIEDILPGLPVIERTDEPACELMVALECGGSDGTPASPPTRARLPRTSRPVRLARRSSLKRRRSTALNICWSAAPSSQEVGPEAHRPDPLWEDYTRRHNGEMNNNPRRQIGRRLTTILEIARRGRQGRHLAARRRGALRPRDHHQGLVFMDSPATIPAANTGQIASGCQIVCFTTGAARPSGREARPTIKLGHQYSGSTPRWKRTWTSTCGTSSSVTPPSSPKGEEIFSRILDWLPASAPKASF
jgi:altronate hydrolase